VAASKRVRGGDRGRKPGRIGGGRGTGGGRGKGGRWEFQREGKREKQGEITQHCIIFRNRKRAKGRKPRKKGGGAGIARYGRRKI